MAPMVKMVNQVILMVKIVNLVLMDKTVNQVLMVKILKQVLMDKILNQVLMAKILTHNQQVHQTKIFKIKMVKQVAKQIPNQIKMANKIQAQIPNKQVSKIKTKIWVRTHKADAAFQNHPF